MLAIVKEFLPYLLAGWVAADIWDHSKIAGVIFLIVCILIMSSK